MPSLPTCRLPPSPWLALPVTAVTRLPSSQLPRCGDRIPMRLTELQAHGWPLLAEPHSGHPQGHAWDQGRWEQGWQPPPAKC